MNEEAKPAQDPVASGENAEPETVEVSFRVCWGKTSDRATGAVLVLTPAGDTPRPGTIVDVDEDGDRDVALAEGEWSCTAIHPDGRQLKPKTLKVPGDVPKPGDKAVLRLVSLTRDISQQWGQWTFAILAALLVILIWAWIDSHRRYPNPSVPSRASAMLDAAAQLKADLAEADDPRESERFLASIEALGSHLDSSQLKGDLKKELDEVAKHKGRLEQYLLTNGEKLKLELQELDVYLAEWSGAGGEPEESDSGNSGGGAANDDEASVDTPTETPTETPTQTADQAKSDPRKTRETLKSAKNEADLGTAPNENKSLATLLEELAAFQDDQSLSEEIRKELNGHEQSLRARLVVEEETANKALKKLLLDELASLEAMFPALAALELETSRGTTRSFLWSRPPMLYLEILFWATAGILVQLIITIAGYLRWNTFIKNGIYLHAALLITVPLLTLVFVQIISMGRLTADDSTVVLDLSDPRIVAGAAFLIALVPWRLWDRIRGAGRKVLGDNDDGD